MQITQFNVITEIPFDFSQKYKNGTAAESPCYSVFGNAIDFCRLYTSKKNLNVGLANRPAFCRQVPLFYAKCPSKNILQVGRSVLFCAESDEPIREYLADPTADVLHPNHVTTFYDNYQIMTKIHRTMLNFLSAPLLHTNSN